ncbi:MAG: uroporphyrinogen decarboxylase family protein [Planctomycetota bacterium]
MNKAVATQSEIEQRKQRWRELYDPASGRKAVFMIGMNDPASPGAAYVPPYPENKAARIDAAMQNYRVMLDRAGWLNDDAIPFAEVHTGTEIFAELFGCEVYRNDGSMPSARPVIFEPRDVAKLKVRPVMDSPLAMLFEIGDELRRQAGPDVLLKIPDIQSPMDIAALIWDKTSFYMGIHDDPQAVDALALMCRELLIEFCDLWLARYGRDFIAHYPAYYMPSGLTLSEDEIGAVSPDMFTRFFLPHLTALSDRYGGLGMHCCATARHQWDNMKKIPNLKILNLTRGLEETEAGIVYFADHCVQIHDGMPGDKPTSWYIENAPSARVVIRPWAEDRAAAQRFVDQLRPYCDLKR